MRLAILGAGQLGGSFALALRQAKADFTIAAYDSEPVHTAYLHKQGAIHIIGGTPEQTVADADIVLFSAPLRSYQALAKAIAPALKLDAIITDTGSVKASMQRLGSILPPARIVPAHPITGTERSGPEVAQPNLFFGRLCILTPDERTDNAALAAIEFLWNLVGAEIMRLPVGVHDQVYAQVSHLPHFIAFVTAQFLHQHELHMEQDDAMLQQFLRISRSDPRMWTDVALENREALLSALDTYTAVLEHIVNELRSGEPGTPSLDAAKTLLPRILASALISTVTFYEQQSGMQLRPFMGAGMRDISAPVLEAPEADIEAISNAAESIATMLEFLLQSFRRLEGLIGAEDEPALFHTLTSMANDAHALAGTGLEVLED